MLRVGVSLDYQTCRSYGPVFFGPVSGPMPVCSVNAGIYQHPHGFQG